MRFGVVVFPGSNCDQDCVHVVRDVLGQDAVEVWHGERSVAGLDAVILPGGFAYGDYLRAGAVAATSQIIPAIRAFAEDGGPVLGICNGFQVLVEAGLLSGAMLRNDVARFQCKPVWLRVESIRTPFTRGLVEGQVLRLPIAHGEGNYYAPPAMLDALERSDQVVFRYCDPSGAVTADANPNGSAHNIAGIASPRGNVLGLMPHPERAAETVLGSTDGRRLFESVIASLSDGNAETRKRGNASGDAELTFPRFRGEGSR